MNATLRNHVGIFFNIVINKEMTDISYIVIGCVVAGVLLYALQGFLSTNSFRPSDGSIARENPGADMNSKFGSNAYPSERNGVHKIYSTDGDDDWGVNPLKFKDGGKRRHRRRRRKSKRH